MRRRSFAAGAAVLVAAGATGTGWWVWHRPTAVPTADDNPTATATVRRTDLASSTQVPGRLGYRGSYQVYAQGNGGTVTAVPTSGQLITRGQPVFELDDQPVRLFYAARPAWRPLALGVTDGPDVRALEENLVALGYASTADSHFNQATAAAVRRWQKATGQPVTGRVELGAVSYQPGPLRITTVTASLGVANRGDQPVLSATSTTPIVVVDVPAEQTYLIHAGDAVTVTLPAGTVLTGRVASLSTVADAPQRPQDNGPQRSPTVPALITLDKPDAVVGLDQAPVQVTVTDAAVAGVLTVPVTALVALAGGGYGVYLRDGVNRRLVAVTTGLFADTLVQVTGNDLHEGDKVEVPAE